MTTKPQHLLHACNLAAEARDLLDYADAKAAGPPKYLVDAIERLADAVRYLAAEVEAQSKRTCEACGKGEFFPHPPPHTCARVSP
jgi:hypothetical protein